MAAKTRSTSPDFSQRFFSMLSYACSELCVIVLLHVATVASYAATRLARNCSLRVPCILCSRLDHALHGKPWFSADLLCTAHRSEISALAYCNGHNQLARSDDLCKRCLLASTGFGASKEVHSRSRSRCRRPCSCCSEPFKGARNSRMISEKDMVRGSEESNRRNQVDAGDRNVPAHHLNEKTFVVGIEEVNETDGSPGRNEQYTKGNGASANAGTAKPVCAKSSATSRIFMDRNSSVKNAILTRINLPSPRPSEIISTKDNNSTTQQQVKALISQMSSTRGFDCSSNEASPNSGINTQSDEISAICRRPSLERNYSVVEPSDGNLADDAEGECSVENLKKQLELNKKSMATLYKELEEERSASAVAASQTMAMINRLQEEKAAMQMEATQYLRMMEEQADHDHEAIQNLHDLLTDREKELLDMEAELEDCLRILQNEQFGAERFDGTDKINSTGDDRNVAFEFLNGTEFASSTMSYFEDEKAYILESLSRLEENLRISTSKLASDDKKHRRDDILLEDHTRADGEYSPVGREPISGESTSVRLHDENESIEENHRDKSSCSPSGSDNMSDPKALKNEISLLNTRLKALEADQKFLRQVLSSLECGNDGMQRVQEITNQLVELRRVVTH